MSRVDPFHPILVFLKFYFFFVVNGLSSEGLEWRSHLNIV